MWIDVARDRCIGAGQCVLTAGSVFDQDELDGIVRLLTVQVAPSVADRVREAVRLCPAQALSLRGDAPVP